ncbi:MAG: golvesin C-terminal-like domain-containing protein, partial [Planctomycetota bacterium]
EGTGFGNAPGDLHLAGQPVPPGEVFAWSDTGIHCWVPPGALSGDLVVQTAGISSNGFPFTVTGPDPTPPQRTRAGWNGALSGNFVVLSPGHGTYYHTNLNAWTTQRPDCWGLIEDRHTCEIAVDFLIPMLERAGARVFSCRERSRQTFEGILDEGVGLPLYCETGTWNSTTAVGSGYNGTLYRYAQASPTETATAMWRFTTQEGGIYPLYVWYRASANRCTDARYRIHHQGGVSEVRVNQQRFGSRWLYIGDFPFATGSTGCITLSNRSTHMGSVVIADAVRIGGGMGSLVRGGSASGQPRWMECARYWTEFMGAPPSVWNLTGTDRT